MSTFSISNITKSISESASMEDEVILNEAAKNELFENMLVEELCKFDDDQLAAFLESDLCETLITEGKMRRNTVVLLSKKDDQSRRTMMGAMQLAKANNDPLWEKLKKNRLIERQLLSKIMRKYGNKAKRNAIVQQKDWIKNRMPANFGKFGGSDRVSKDAATGKAKSKPFERKYNI